MGITFMVLKSRQWHQWTWEQSLRGWVPFPLFTLISKHFSRTKQVLGPWRIPLLKKRGVHPGHRKQVTLHLHLRGKNIRTYSFIFKYSHGFLHFCVFLFLEKNTSEKNPQQSQQKSPPSSTWKWCWRSCCTTLGTCTTCSCQWPFGATQSTGNQQGVQVIVT